MEDNATASANIFTLGHFNPRLDYSLRSLRVYGVQVVVDTQSQPYSTKRTAQQ